MKFKKHTSKEMVKIFKKRPFQGQVPEKASIVFLSSDANYSPEISKHSFFKYIFEYQKDGIAFWEKYGCHHPFMLSNYPKEKGFDRRKDGVPFHRNFSKLGLRAEQHAEHISFLELLNVPTIGNKSEDMELFFDLLCQDHLKYINRLILSGGHKKLFFVSKGVLDDINEIKKIYPNLFSWYADDPQKGRFLKEINGNKVKEIYHFSSSKIHGQLDDIRLDIDEWLDDN